MLNARKMKCANDDTCHKGTTESVNTSDITNLYFIVEITMY